VASTGVYLYRRSAQSSDRQQYGYGAPITEVAADKDFEDGAGMISPMSRVSGLPRFSYDPSEHKPNKRKCTDDDTDVELGEIPRSVYVSTPNTSIAVSDPESKENVIIRGVQKYFGQAAKAKESKSSNKKGMTWNQIRDEGSPACSSGFAPASIPSMFSPVPVRGLPALLENVPSGSNDSDRIDTESLEMKKSGSASLAIVKSGSASSYHSNGMMSKKSDSSSYNSRQLDITKSRSSESYVHINKSGSVESNSSSKYANIMASASAYSNATKSIKSKSSFFAHGDDDASNEEAVKSVKSNATKSVKSYGSSISGSKKDNASLKPDDFAPSFEENVSEIKNILKSISGEQPADLYTKETNESNDDVPMSYSETPPELSPQSLSSSFVDKTNDQTAPQSDDFAFDADFDNATMHTKDSDGFNDKDTPREMNGAQLLSPITYEKELKTSDTCQEFSFGNLLSDPNNELYECHAPPGPLGIVIDSTPLGPRVKSLNPMSSLFDSMSPGDIIVGIDDIDTVGMEAAEFWQLVSRKANQRKRILTMLKI
jgi:hypothetical protein